jgi:hypothetical protein
VAEAVFCWLLPSWGGSRLSPLLVLVLVVVVVLLLLLVFTSPAEPFPSRVLP